MPIRSTNEHNRRCQAKDLNPSRDDFAALLAESLAKDDVFEGSVVKGKIVGIEKDLAVIDVGLKMEGRVPLREFALPGKPADLKVGDDVEVYLERIENALGEAVLSRDKARREESWTRLEKKFNTKREGRGRHLQQGQGRLHGRPRRRRGVPARQPGRHPPGARHRPADALSRSRSRS